MKTNNKKKILVLCPYPVNCAPSQRLKFEQYYDYFEENGFEVTVSSFVLPAFWNILYKKGYWLLKAYYTILGYFIRFLDLFRLHQFDIIYIHLWVTPLGPPLFERLVKLFSKKIIYDIDDMLFLGHSSDVNSMILAIKGKKKIDYLLKKSDFVITSAPTIEQYASKFNKNVKDIPPTIDYENFPAKTDYSIGSELILGYSGSHSTLKYLKSIEPVFDELLNTGIPFKVLVISNSDFCFNNKNIPLEVKYWKLEEEVNLLHQMDIGLFPLTDEPWVYGKRGGKALLYMAIGLPIIATAIGANLDTFKDNQNGFLVNVGDYKTWVKQIILLKDNLHLREHLGLNARKTLEERFSTEVNKEYYLEILKSLTSD